MLYKYTGVTCDAIAGCETRRGVINRSRSAARTPHAKPAISDMSRVRASIELFCEPMSDLLECPEFICKSF
jgi:hypothetical protein